ncbi:hypothetical protein BCR33DRAFT_715133 [Rhizoclosmatium globosum]|uniref:Uncharacterized protein n=1 Tax=Rhizoclosmatium globosum TaxID=329046 RepID=A0A1Y2CK72_9FUNG|nr:hypothetical protein BCR33DRAFT_715133 [Rhizoclosmatium globosum]|eukprot:ORY47418.1 hypothetical protein BCR33DRAFT_715133 [Rhizoclosmatium globosum]
MPSIRFRDDISPQDIIAIVSMATLSVIAFTEATAFTIFVTYTERKNPKREPSLIHRIFNKFNVLLLTMFIMSLIWSICACYSITRTHSNLSLIAPQSVETFSSAIIEIWYTYTAFHPFSMLILRHLTQTVSSTAAGQSPYQSSVETADP